MAVKGLRKMIYPFAPDQSGASAVLYELGGMIIICDAGGCAGNVCGFDEPRWVGTKSQIFSAGLRDMDAILGRDDLMISKIAKASEKLDSNFVAIIGTPVPATIATDYKALRRMAEKKIGLPVITMDTSGAGLYDEGIEKAYRELLRCFAGDGSGDGEVAKAAGTAGVLGITPLDMDCMDAAAKIREILKAEGAEEVICCGADGDLDEIRRAGSAEKNIVVSAAGLKAARWLKEHFGIPYECRDPLIGDVLDYIEAGHPGLIDGLGGKRVLIIHQQVRANALRDLIRSRSDAEVTVGTWFRLDPEIREPDDIRIKEEDDFFRLMESGRFDVVIADGILRKAAKAFTGIYADLPHFAVSGDLMY